MNLFYHFAKCNRIVNNRLAESLSECGNEAFIQERNCFYESILGICDHVYVGDVVFLRDMAISLGSEIRNDELFQINHKYRVREISSLEDYFKKREYLDDLIIEFTRDLSEDALEKEVAITTDLAGNKTKNKLYKVLTQFFSHQIHHRGHISQILDEVGIENDFSTIYFLE